MIFTLTKIEDIYFIVLMILLKLMVIQDKKLNTKKMLDSVGIQKMEEKSKQFLVEKLIHGIEFKNPYKIETEKKPEIIQTVEHNYEIVRRVYQQLWADISEFFAEFITSINPLKLRNMSEDIKANGWGTKKMIIMMLIMLKIL